ncbi:hypothetical protein QAD02_007829 [Eretmocerus hayati]|uniref:Uncharacterized protein n=1 Tax=Eretmocerus hayati TaxID=131215 RepID=A0ACC2N4S1_9HYME|nr:hypothetical protein QAD02_007829 [Eretmocerus hayati]
MCEPFLRVDKSVQTGHAVLEFGKGLSARKKLFGCSARYQYFQRPMVLIKCQKTQTEAVRISHKATQTEEKLRLLTAPAPRYIPTPKFLLAPGSIPTLPQDTPLDAPAVVDEEEYIPEPVNSQRRESLDAELYKMCELLEGAHADQLFNSVKRAQFLYNEKNIGFDEKCEQVEKECADII